jgi:exo-1,4-beta-D-glucosaminidase
MVTYDILPQVIPNLVWDKKLPFPLNDMWGYHDASTGNGRWDLYYMEMIKRYGDPSSMEDFCNKMQLMNATGYQGIFEAAGHKLNDIGGVMLWKLNAAFPSVVWQVYDWYLQTNAGYYFMQNACEPLHVQLNLVNNRVMVINRRYKPAEDLSVTAEVFDIDSKPLFREEKKISLSESSVEECISMDEQLSDRKELSFVILNLKNNAGKVISKNAYWISGDGNYTSLQGLERTTVECVITNRQVSGSRYSSTVTISNKSDRIAFFIRPRLMLNEEEILPSFWSAGYFTLSPGERIEVNVTCPANLTFSKKPSIKIEGWNIEPVIL